MRVHHQQFTRLVLGCSLAASAIAAVAGATRLRPQRAARPAFAKSVRGMGPRRTSAVSTARLPLGSAVRDASLMAALKAHMLLYLPDDQPPPGSVGMKASVHACMPWDACPMDSGGCGGGAGPSAGDPVNLATGEEAYQPPADLTVYNPNGPAVVWRRIYNSMRGPSAGYESDDLGIGWSHPYNVWIEDPNYSMQGPNAMPKNLVFPDGARLSFTPAGLPSSTNPQMSCTVASGTPLTIEWDYDASSSYGKYLVRFGDGTRWWFYTSGMSKTTSNEAWYPLGRIENVLIKDPDDPTGATLDGLNFNYVAGLGTNGFPLLSSVVDSRSGNALLTLHRPDSTGRIDWVKDAYSRYVYYSVLSQPCTNCGGLSYEELTQVSQILPGVSGAPPMRWMYGYANYSTGMPGNPSGTQMVPFLSQITVPSPTGSGNSTTTITYNSSSDVVASIQDGNGIYRTYQQATIPMQPMGTDATQVLISTVPNPTPAQVLFAYTTVFDSMGRRLEITDGTTNSSGQNTNVIATIAYTNSNAPQRPSQITNGNGKIRTFSWDQFGNLLTASSPHIAGSGIVTNYAWTTTTDFPTGQLTSVQEVSNQGVAKTTAMLKYFPSTDAINKGRLMEIDTPTPGTTGTGATVKTTYTYDSLGNVVTITQPGTDTTPMITTTLGYTSDTNETGSMFSQADKIGQPLTVTDNAQPTGNVTHFRYDLRGNLLSARDALNNKASAVYNVADQPVAIALPHTGEQGPNSVTTG